MFYLTLALARWLLFGKKKPAIGPCCSSSAPFHRRNSSIAMLIMREKKSLLWNTFDALQVCQCQCFSAAALFNTSVRLSTLYERSWTMARFSHALVINYSVATSWNFCTARPVDPPRHFTWRLRAKFAVAVLRWKGEFWVLRTLRQWLSINWYCDNLFAEQLKDLLRLLQWKVDNILR